MLHADSPRASREAEGQPVPAGQVRNGDLLDYLGRELLVTGTYGTWYHEHGQPVAGLAIECRTGSAWWILYRRPREILRRLPAAAHADDRP